MQLLQVITFEIPDIEILTNWVIKKTGSALK